jgi:demethylmenaquinone methyltransferase/2-methoxy-6-polyprenyl-1,4-benzoquinol methylase
MTRADLAKDPRDVAAMFDTVARRYDLTNDVLSGYQTRRWRASVAAAVAPVPGERILDLAAGTGTSSLPLVAAGAYVVACDFSLGMLRQGKRQQPGLPFVAGDGLALPFRDEAFDAVTISFGLRNLAVTSAGLAELLRVTRPGGRLVVCEFSTPTNAAFRTVYLEYLMQALPAIARRTASNPQAYDYLAESIRAWPDQRALAEQILRAGWRQVQYRNLTGGVVALHRALRP